MSHRVILIYQNRIELSYCKPPLAATARIDLVHTFIEIPACSEMTKAFN
jgi:hypothetical protein